MFHGSVLRARLAPVLRQATVSQALKNVAVRSYQTSAAPAGLTSQQIMVRGVIGGAAAFGVVGLCVMGQKADENTQGWHSYVTERVSSTYGHLAGGLAMTAGSAYLFSHSQALLRTMTNHPMAFALGGMALTIGSMVATRSIPMENTLAKMSAWTVFNGSVGMTLAPVAFLGGPIVLKAAIYTGAVVGGLSLVAMSAKSDQFLSWGTPLAIGLGVVCITSLGRVFLPAHFFIAHTIMENVMVYGGMVVFSGLVLYDTQKIVHKAKYAPAGQFDPVNESMHIYLDAINLFRIIVSQVGGRK